MKKKQTISWKSLVAVMRSNEKYGGEIIVLLLVVEYNY